MMYMLCIQYMRMYRYRCHQILFSHSISWHLFTWLASNLFYSNSDVDHHHNHIHPDPLHSFFISTYFFSICVCVCFFVIPFHFHLCFVFRQFIFFFQSTVRNCIIHSFNISILFSFSISLLCCLYFEKELKKKKKT